MATEVIMPVLDMTTEEMTILRWIKGEGETIKKGDPLLEVLTEKISIEIDAPVDGVVRGIRYQSEAVVPTGEVIAYIAAEGEDWSAEGEDWSAKDGASTTAADAVAAATVAAPAVAVSAAGGAAARAVRAAPVVRRIAADLGVDLERVQGTGPGERVLAADVRASVGGAAGVAQGAVQGAESGAVQGAESGAVPGVTGAPLSPVRQVIARRMQQSWREAPHVTLTMAIEMSAAAAFRLQLREALAAEGSDAALTWNSLIAWFTVQALVRRPELNVTLENDRLHSHVDVNLGVAVDTPTGLLVPVIPAAQRLRPSRLAEALARSAAKAEAGTLTLTDMAAATFTVTNLGGFGIDAFTPILNPPQVGILGVGAVQDAIVPVAGQPAVRPMCTFSLSFDHRAVDGADGARFLVELRELLLQPHRLVV